MKAGGGDSILAGGFDPVEKYQLLVKMDHFPR